MIGVFEPAPRRPWYGRLVAPTDPFGLVGQVLDGQFRVDRYVGEGGFSIVYTARTSA